MVQVVQKSLDAVSPSQREAFVRELEPKILECVTSPNGNHVIQVSIHVFRVKIRSSTTQRLMFFGPPDSIFNAFVGRVVTISTNPFGCRVMQKVFELLRDPRTTRLFNELYPSTRLLIQDSFGSKWILAHVNSG